MKYAHKCIPNLKATLRMVIVLYLTMITYDLSQNWKSAYPFEIS